MKFEASDKLIFLQIADWIVDNILSGVFSEGEQIPSVAELSSEFQINHITILKGINTLTDQGILFKKRGVGMFVSEGAKERIHSQRKQDYFRDYISKAILEAKKLDITENELIDMIREGYKNERIEN